MAEGDISDLVFGFDNNMEQTDGQGEKLIFSVPTHNRFDTFDGRGRGGEKRKKMTSSTGSDKTEETRLFLGLDTDEKLLCMFEGINRNCEKLESLKSIYDGQMKELQQVNVKVTQHDKLFDLLMNKIKMLSYRSLDSEARDRRNNILFWGITENVRNTNCVDLIERFMLYEMDIDPDCVSVERAHRVPMFLPPNQGDRKRPIIVKFRDYPNTDLVMRHAYKLKGTGFRVDRDYPREIADARKALNQLDCVKKARENRARVQIKYPARLYINNKLERDMFPGWFDNLRESRIHGFRLNFATDHTTRPVLEEYTRNVSPPPPPKTTPQTTRQIQTEGRADDIPTVDSAQTPRPTVTNKPVDLSKNAESTSLFKTPNPSPKSTPTRGRSTSKTKNVNSGVKYTARSKPRTTSTPARARAPRSQSAGVGRRQVHQDTGQKLGHEDTST